MHEDSADSSHPYIHSLRRETAESVIVISSGERVALGNGCSVTDLGFLLFGSTIFPLGSPRSCDFQK